MSNSFPRRLFWIVVLYLLEVTFGARLGAFAPPLVLAAVIGIALDGGAGAGLGWGAFAGLLFEPFASGPLGSAPLAYALVGWGTGALSSKMFGESVWVRALWPCAALAAAAAIEASWGRPAGSGVTFWEAWSAALPLGRFLAAALVTPWIVSRVRPPKRDAGARRLRTRYS